MGTAISLFLLTLGIAMFVAIVTKLRAERAQDEHRHFGGVPHRSIYADLDTSMSARERLDQRSDFTKFRRDRTQEVLREERAQAGG